MAGGWRKSSVGSEVLGHISDDDEKKSMKALMIQSESLKVFDINVKMRKGDMTFIGTLELIPDLRSHCKNGFIIMFF